MKSTFRNVLLFMVILFAFTACGGGSSSSGTDTEKQEIAIKKISDYASDWQSHAQPTQDDYIAAGVENISAIDVDDLNAIVRDSEAEEVDTAEELNTLVRTLMDTTAPIITLNGNSSISITIGNVYVEKGATALDNKDGDISSKIVTVNTVDTSKEGSYTVTYSVEDEAGNSTEKIRTVNVVKHIDTTPPVLTLNGSETITVIKNEAYIELGAESNDNDFDGVLPVDISGEVDITRVGDYDIIYTATNAAGLEVSKTRTVHVILSAVGQLLEDSAKGLNTDVHYIVVGDSTRNYPFVLEGNNKTNTILVDSYYRNQLTRIGVTFDHTAYSGIEAYRWKENISEYPGGKIKPRLQDTLNKIPSANHSNYIVEFSLGINDARYETTTRIVLKATIKDAIEILHRNRQDIKVLMVSPVSYKLYQDVGPVTTNTMEELYKEVYSELLAEGANYLAFVSGREATKDVTDCLNNGANSDNCEYYGDSIHPAENGSLRLVNYIFSEIGGSKLHEKMTVSSNDSPTTPPMLLDDMHVELDIRLEER